MKLPKLEDMRKKDFTADGERERPTGAEADEDLIDRGAVDPDEESVLMDRNDYSRLSYYARKELDRHKDEPSTRELLKRQSKARGDDSGANIGPLSGVMLAVALLLLLYGLLSLASWPVGEYLEGRLAARYPADFVLRPSTALHRQGELTRAPSDTTVDAEGRVLAFFFFHPTLNRLDVQHLVAGDQRQYDLAEYGSGRLVIAGGPWGGSLAVNRHYGQTLPINVRAVFNSAYLSLETGGVQRLRAVETFRSGMLPGLLEMMLYDGGDSRIGLAYLSDGHVQVHLDAAPPPSSAEEIRLSKELIMLFSLVET